MKKALLGGIAILLFAMLYGPALAADFVQPSPGNPNVTIGPNETRRNVYIAGTNVSVSGSIGGDLVAAGGAVAVLGPVEKELLAAGGTLNITGAIGDTARVAGGNVTITGRVGGDLVAGGGNVTITDASAVGGDLVLAGGNATVGAPVAGKALITGGNVTINSRVNGDVTVRSTRGLVFGPNADIGGRVVYTGPAQAVVQPGARVPNIEFTQLQDRGRGTARGLLTVAFLIRLLAWIIAGALLIRFVPQLVNRAVDNMRSSPWSSLGWGIVGAVVIPIVIVLLFLVLVGYYVAAVTAASFALLLLLAKLLSVIAVGWFIVRLMDRRIGTAAVWQAVVAGAVALAVIDLIPVAGWLFSLIVGAMALGAILRIAGRAVSRREERAAA